jgi:hypothetical protein
MFKVFTAKKSEEMPEVQKCDALHCGYNVNSNCHAKAITVGDYLNPGCDTFLGTERHIKETKRIAGVGACKVSNCKFNDDYECSAPNISVGLKEGKVNCLTFTKRD